MITSQWNLGSPCVFWCFLYASFVLKDLSHCSHEYGRFSSCMAATCRSKLHAVSRHFPQRLHVNGRYPVCLDACLSKADLVIYVVCEKKYIKDMVKSYNLLCYAYKHGSSMCLLLYATSSGEKPVYGGTNRLGFLCGISSESGLFVPYEFLKKTLFLLSAQFKNL